MESEDLKDLVGSETCGSSTSKTYDTSLSQISPKAIVDDLSLMLQTQSTLMLQMQDIFVKQKQDFERKYL